MKKIWAILPVAFVLAACGPVQLDTTQLQAAQIAARDFADRVSAQYVSCSTQDSEPDGYVSCTIQPKATGTDNKPPYEILCSYQSAIGGCKPK